ncbi:MAG: two-component system sensor histidine kinase CreC [Fibrobacterales bacterium]
MTLRLRALLSLLLLVAGGLYIVYDILQNEISPRYREAIEESLIDESQVISRLINTPEGIDTSQVRRAFEGMDNQSIEANIYGVSKTSVDLRVYVTDAQGSVLFHSFKPELKGSDFSQWRDVHLTLRGKYGARTTRDVQENATSTVLYVAAPIIQNDSIIGVVTVGKPTIGINRFIENTKTKFLRFLILLGVIITAIVVAFSVWLTAPIKRMIHYTRTFDAEITEGRKHLASKHLPKELREVGDRLQSMQSELKARHYVEEYIQILTHEIKSPLTAIKGAAELLHEEMPAEDRERFMSNIENEADRIDAIISKMVELAKIEQLVVPDQTERCEIDSIITQQCSLLKSNADTKNISLSTEVAPFQMNGDKELLDKLFSNLIKNAIDFSPKEGTITVAGAMVDDSYQIVLKDEGPGIPNYALERVFEKFYSLPRPGETKKSSGIGLTFAKRVIELHKGEISLHNQKPVGLQVTVTFKQST